MRDMEERSLAGALLFIIASRVEEHICLSSSFWSQKKMLQISDLSSGGGNKDLI